MTFVLKLQLYFTERYNNDNEIVKSKEIKHIKMSFLLAKCLILIFFVIFHFL